MFRFIKSLLKRKVCELTEQPYKFRIGQKVKDGKGHRYIIKAINPKRPQAVEGGKYYIHNHYSCLNRSNGIRYIIFESELI